MDDSVVMKISEFEEILQKLPPADAERLRAERKVLMKNSTRSAAAAVMTRNMSHGLGKFLKK